MRETALKGKCTGGKISIGYRINDEHYLEIDPHTAHTPCFIIEQHAEGHTKTEIARACNENGWKTRSGKDWTINSVGYVLANAMYKGDYTYKKGEIERSYPALVLPEVFDRSYARHIANKRRRGTKVTDNVVYSLSGKLFCGYCKSLMTGDVGTSHNGERHRYYTCHQRKNIIIAKNEANEKDTSNGMS